MKAALETPLQVKERVFEYQGKSQNIAEWSNELGISRKALNRRLERGKSVEEAFGTPQRIRRK